MLGVILPVVEVPASFRVSLLCSAERLTQDGLRRPAWLEENRLVCCNSLCRYSRCFMLKIVLGEPPAVEWGSGWGQGWWWGCAGRVDFPWERRTIPICSVLVCPSTLQGDGCRAAFSRQGTGVEVGEFGSRLFSKAPSYVVRWVLVLANHRYLGDGYLEVGDRS